MRQNCTWQAIALALSSCTSQPSPATRDVTGVILVTGAEDEGVFSWDQNGAFSFVMPDTVGVVQELRALSAPRDDCVGKLYDATFTVGTNKKRYRVEMGSGELTPLLGIKSAHLTRRSDEQLRTWLHRADLSASRICKAGASPGLAPMTDTYVTASRVMKRR